MGIEHGTLAVGRSNHSPNIKDLQYLSLFEADIYELHYDVCATAFFINRYIIK